MLNPILEFLKKEKFYSALFVLVLLIYGTAAVLSKNSPAHESLKDKRSMERLENQEKAFQAKLRDPVKRAQFLKEHPAFLNAMQALTVLFFMALLGGLAIDYRLVFQPAFRKKISQESYPESTAWDLAMFVKVVILFLLISFLLTLVVAGFKKVFRPQDASHLYMLTHTILVNLFGLFFMVYWVRKKGGTVKDLGLRVSSKGILPEVFSGWLGYAAIVPVFALTLLGMVVISNLLSWEPAPHPLVFMFLDDSGSRFLLIYSLITAVIIGPVMEELFFRGFCYPIFKSRFGPAISAVLTASIFAVVHANTYAFWPIFVLGLALGYLYELRKSIVAPMVLHITHNAVFIGYFLMAQHLIQRYGS